MTNPPKDYAEAQLEGPPEASQTQSSNQTDKQILINWIIVVLGLGGIGIAGAILPELL